MLEVIRPQFESCKKDHCGDDLSKYIVPTEPHEFYIGKSYTRLFYHYFTSKYGQQGVFDYENGSLIGLGTSGTYDTTFFGVKMYGNRKYLIEFEAVINSGSITVNSESISNGKNEIELSNSDTLIFLSTSFDGEISRLKIYELDVFDVYGNDTESDECEFFYRGFERTKTPTQNAFFKYRVQNGNILLNWYAETTTPPATLIKLNQYYLNSLNNPKKLVWSFYDFDNNLGNGVIYGSMIVNHLAFSEFTVGLTPNKWYFATFRVVGIYQISDDNGIIRQFENETVEIYFEKELKFETNFGTVYDIRIYEMPTMYTRIFDLDFDPENCKEIVKMVAQDCTRDVPIYLPASLILVSQNDERYEIVMNNAGKANQLDKGTFEVYEFSSSNLPSDMLEIVNLMVKSPLLTINNEQYILYQDSTNIERDTNIEGSFEYLLIKKDGYLNRNCDICN